MMMPIHSLLGSHSAFTHRGSLLLTLLAIPLALTMACSSQQPSLHKPLSASGGKGRASVDAAGISSNGDADGSLSTRGPGTSVGDTAGASDDASAPRPNIVFVLTDDLSMNLVEHMPHVLQMQRDGVTFTNYFVTDSLCCPSRTSIFTGEYPHSSGVFTNSGTDGGYATYLSQGNDPQTFAVAMSNAGYRTAMMGKFLNGYEPTTNNASMGWSEWDVAGSGYPEFNYDLNQNGKVVHYGKLDADYLTDVVSGLGQVFIKRKSAKPFLIEVASFAPHAPYIPAPRHASMFPALTYPTTPAFNARPSATAPTWLQALPALKPAQIATINNHFRMRAQAVQAVDEMIDALEKELIASGHDKDTYIFFSSDNGYHMGEHSQPPGKMTAFDTDVHVPLIVTGPGVPAGLRIDQIAQNIDLCPTFTELGQAGAPSTVNGHSLVQLLHGQTAADWRNVALIEHHDPKFDPNDPDADTGVVKNPPTYEALRTADSVYVEYVGGETEYHDRTSDPYELNNTVASLPASQVTKLHDTISAVKACKTANECWMAQHMSP
jgi:N-acetylglucosamine-6-sulfatase